MRFFGKNPNRLTRKSVFSLEKVETIRDFLEKSDLSLEKACFFFKGRVLSSVVRMRKPAWNEKNSKKKGIGMIKNIDSM